MARLSRKTRTKVIAYIIALLVPIALASSWRIVPLPFRDAPGLTSLLFIALIARFLGVGPAILSTSVLAGMLWFHLIPIALGTRTPSFRFLVMTYFIAIALAIASMSRQRSARVRAAECRYRSFVELAPDPHFVADKDGTILFVNAAFAQLVGVARPSDVVDMNIRAFVHPDSNAPVTTADGASDPWTRAKWRTVDGDHLDVETAVIELEQDDDVVLQGFVRDLTERTRAAQRVEEHQLRLQALFDTAMDAILFTDRSGRYVDANAAATELLGYSREEIISKKVGAFTRPEELPFAASTFEELKTKGRMAGERTIVRKDGQLLDVEIRTIANVRPGLYCTFLHDITARKIAERSLRQLSGRLVRLQDDERRRIARSLHETVVQNLGAIRLNLARISKWASTAGDAVREAVDETSALSDQSIAEIRTLSYLLHPPLIDEAGLIPSLRWLVRGFQDRSGIEVSLEMPNDLRRLPCDIETAVFRVVQEALTNVQRHSGSHSARIRLRDEEGSIRVAIDDEGTGIPPVLRANEQALAAAGVGIAGMRERVRELGGTLRIASAETGTTVEVTLPATEVPLEHTHS